VLGLLALHVALLQRKQGCSYVIIEKGCLVNSLYNYPANMTFFSTSERLEIGGVPFMSLNNKPNRAEALEYYRRVTQVFSLNVHLFEEVNTVTKNDDNFLSVTTSRNDYKAKHIIVSTGFYDLPVLMHVPGEEMNKVVHYYKDPHYYAFQKVLVVGAQNSAIDAALETWRKGAEVTMVVREKEIGERVKYWVRPDIINRIAEGSIKAYFNASVIEIRKEEVDIQTPNGPVTIANDFVIAMTGYRPGFDFLRKIGVELSNDESLHPSYDPATMETNNKGIYLAGVVCGGMDTHKWFIENSREHADKIIQHIVSNRHTKANCQA
jgi:thioredoxin reductase (NADPH)